MFLLAFCLCAMICRPATVFSAANQSLVLWYSVVVPALLPFLIFSELLISLGAAQTAGRWLAPLMRPLFNLPGEAALGLIMGFCSGFPTGAAVTASLWRQRLLTTEEAGRLTAFTNNAGPLYITVAVATGLLQRPAAGLLLALTHYGVNLLLGVILGLLSRLRVRGHSHPFSTPHTERTRTPGTVAPAADPAAMTAQPPAFAQRLKAAAKHGSATLLMIGCYMVFFSVVAALVGNLLPFPGQPLLQAASRGIWEMSLGVNALCDSGLPLSCLLPLIAAQLAFGGVSVQAQVLAMLAGTDISGHAYLLSRPFHSLLAALLTALLQNRLPLPAAEGWPTPPLPIPGNAYLLLALLATALWLLLASAKG